MEKHSDAVLPWQATPGGLDTQGRVLLGRWGCRDLTHGAVAATAASPAAPDAQQDDDADDAQDQKEDDLALHGFALIALGHDQLALGAADVDGGAFNVVVDAVEEGALVNDHGVEVAKEVGELDDALGDALDLALALLDERVVDRGRGAVELLLLLDRGLGEGPVGVGFEEGRVRVEVCLDGGGGAVGRAVEAAERFEFCII
jgi:hypothetical protein